MAHRSHPETLCSVPHRASDIAAPFLHRPFRFHVSGTQRTYSIMNLGIMPLTLAPKSAPDFRRECALTHSIAFGKNAQPAPERCRSERVWDFPTSILQRKICICAHECTACQSYLNHRIHLSLYQFFLNIVIIKSDCLLQCQKMFSSILD